VEQGSATISIPATSSVISSTLAPASGASGATTSSENPVSTGATGSNGSLRLGSYSLSLLMAAFIITVVVELT